MNADQAVVIRGDEAGAYKNIVERAQHLQRSRRHECRLRDRKMRWLAGCAALLLAAPLAFAQNEPPVRRAVPVHEPPVARAVPVESSPAEPLSTPTIRRALPVPEEPENIAPTPAPTPAATAERDEAPPTRAR